MCYLTVTLVILHSQTKINCHFDRLGRFFISRCYGLACLLDYQCGYLHASILIIYHHLAHLKFLPWVYLLGSMPCAVTGWLIKCACRSTAVCNIGTALCLWFWDLVSVCLFPVCTGNVISQ